MRSFSLPVMVNGPLIRIEVGFPRPTELALRRAGRPVLTPLSLDALVDTGADASMVDHELLTPFVREGLHLRAMVHVNAPGLGGLSLAPQFVVGFRILHPSGNDRSDLVFHETEVIEHLLGAPGYQALIGRDILSRCIFTFDGPANTFTLTY